MHVGSVVAGCLLIDWCCCCWGWVYVVIVFVAVAVLMRLIECCRGFVCFVVGLVVFVVVVFWLFWWIFWCLWLLLLLLLLVFVCCCCFVCFDVLLAVGVIVVVVVDWWCCGTKFMKSKREDNSKWNQKRLIITNNLPKLDKWWLSDKTGSAQQTWNYSNTHWEKYT